MKSEEIQAEEYVESGFTRIQRETLDLMGNCV